MLTKQLNGIRINWGFELVMTVPQSGKYEWALMKKDSMEIMFQTKKSLGDELPPIKSLPVSGSMILYVGVDNIKEIYDELKNKVRICKDLHKTFYGSEEFAIEDYNGFVILFSAKK